MATIAYSSTTDRGEARFFFIMACVMAAIVVGGFSLNLAMGRSTFAAPWLFHVHAVIMMAWVGVYVSQNMLIFSNNVAMHRRLGWLAVVLVPLILITGFFVTRLTLQMRGGPPFFAQNQFLFDNAALLLTFAGFTAWAIALRRDTGWHRRLMFCGFALLTGPGVGRLLPSIYMVPYTWYLTVILPAVLFPAIGMMADKRRYGAIHPAWLWGVGLMLAFQLVAELIAFSAWGVGFTEQFLAGTPGSERPMEAFIPGAPPA